MFENHNFSKFAMDCRVVEALSHSNSETQRSNLYELSHCCIYHIWHIVLFNLLTRTSLNQGDTHISKTKRPMYRKRVINIFE